MFFALAGAKDDGLAYTAQAAVKGASVIIAEREPPPSSAAYVHAADARLAVQRAIERERRVKHVCDR